MSFESVIERLGDLRKDIGKDSARTKQALIRIGTVLEAKMQLNIRERGLIDKGRLLNSIKYQLKKYDEALELEVGSYSVPYAAQWEFGYRGIQQIREHSRKNKKTGKIANVRAHGRLVNRQARPYVRPALASNIGFIAQILKTIAEPS